MSLELILDLVFPKICQGCNLEGTYFCLDCQSKLSVPLGRCFICKRASIMSRTHDKCLSTDFVLDGLLVAAEYENIAIRNLIWHMKYNYVKEICSVLSLLLSDYFFSNNLSEYFSDTIVVSVPLHKRRYRARGFNQSELISSEFAKRMGLRHIPALHRIRNSKTQVELEKKERFQNVKNLFHLLPNQTLSTDRVILIDDVATTGATLNECAKPLKQIGIKEVWGLVVARN